MSLLFHIDDLGYRIFIPPYDFLQQVCINWNTGEK